VAALALATATVAGCAQTASYPIRQRAYAYMPERHASDYAEELAFVRERRRLLGSQVPPEAANLRGLALSGGGIRSATVSLGVLQALQDGGVLERMDYMSAVSGGAYTAAWVQAHLGAGAQGLEVDEDGYRVAAEHLDELLDPHADHVEHLRTHAGFLNRGGWWEGLQLGWSYLWRWPCALVVDVVIHLKGRINRCHLVDIYKQRLESTYFRGSSEDGEIHKRDLALALANFDEKATPYLILNGNLVNRGGSRAVREVPWTRQFNFEFTRDFTGSDGLGYLPSEAFDRPVAGVHHDDAGVPRQVSVETTGLASEPFPLSYALAAVGAAFDPDGLVARIDREWVRGVTAWAASPLNLNLGYETWNFSRRFDGWGTIYDYFRMFTWQRIAPWVSTNARWIEITDGGHYENLGILSLARRGVSCIVAVDAGADPKFEFSDVKNLRGRLREIGLRLESERPKDKSERVGHYRWRILRQDSDELVSTLLLLKSNAYEGRPHMRTTGDPERDGRIDKIRAFRKRKKSYPHTTTLQQWFDWETFEAYRLVGYQLASTYLRDRDTLERCEFSEAPPADPGA